MESQNSPRKTRVPEHSTAEFYSAIVRAFHQWINGSSCTGASSILIRPSRWCHLLKPKHQYRKIKHRRPHRRCTSTYRKIKYHGWVLLVISFPALLHL